jgi:hypothetical protein
VYLVPPIHRHLQTFHSEGLACAVRLSPALLTLGPFLLLVATSITIALLLLNISLRVHEHVTTESGGLHARRSHTDLAPHVLLTKLSVCCSAADAAAADAAPALNQEPLRVAGVKPSHLP